MYDLLFLFLAFSLLLSLFVFSIPVFSVLVFTTSHIPLDIFLFLPSLFSNWSYDCGRQAIIYPRLYSNFSPLHQSLFSLYILCNIGFFIFFNLKLYFLANSELMTRPITLLSRSISTMTSWVSILSSIIFTITSLKYLLGFSVKLLDNDILLLSTLSIVNLL